LAVDDGPPRPAKPLDEIRAQFQQVEQEPIGAVSPGAIARCGPGVAAPGQVRIERLTARSADAGPFALVAMREHDEAPFQSGGTLIR